MIQQGDTFELGTDDAKPVALCSGGRHCGALHRGSCSYRVGCGRIRRPARGARARMAVLVPEQLAGEKPNTALQERRPPTSEASR